MIISNEANMEVIGVASTGKEAIQKAYEGCSYKQISETSFVATSNIKIQVNNILKKFDKQTMKEVVNLLRELQFHEFLEGLEQK